MKISTQLLIPILAVAAACGGSGSTDATTPPESAAGSHSVALPSDTVLMAKAYDNDYSVPDGFFVDERAQTAGSYTVYHVLDTSSSFEICTDDLVEAQALEQADNDARTVNGYYVTSHETERYFEFVRELNYTADVGNVTDVTSPGFSRIFKCQHTNRDGVDRNLLSGYSGRMDPERLGPSALREFSEYLWQFRFFNARYKKVISSYRSGDAQALQHTLLLAFVYGQGQNTCDRIDVVEWRFNADANSGEVSRDFETVHSFEAMQGSGPPTLCQ